MVELREEEERRRRRSRVGGQMQREGVGSERGDAVDEMEKSPRRLRDERLDKGGGGNKKMAKWGEKADEKASMRFGQEDAGDDESEGCCLWIAAP